MNYINFIHLSNYIKSGFFIIAVKKLSQLKLYFSISYFERFLTSGDKEIKKKNILDVKDILTYYLLMITKDFK